MTIRHGFREPKPGQKYTLEHHERLPEVLAVPAVIEASEMVVFDIRRQLAWPKPLISSGPAFLSMLSLKRLRSALNECGCRRPEEGSTGLYWDGRGTEDARIAASLSDINSLCIALENTPDMDTNIVDALEAAMTLLKFAFKNNRQRSGTSETVSQCVDAQCSVLETSETDSGAANPGGPNESAKNGPAPPNGFRWGVSVVALTTHQFRIVSYLWGQRGYVARVADLVLHVWDDEEKESTALPSALSRLNRTFEHRGLAISVNRSGDYLTLKLP